MLRASLAEHEPAQQRVLAAQAPSLAATANQELAQEPAARPAWHAALFDALSYLAPAQLRALAAQAPTLAATANQELVREPAARPAWHAALFDALSHLAPEPPPPLAPVALHRLYQRRCSVREQVERADLSSPHEAHAQEPPPPLAPTAALSGQVLQRRPVHDKAGRRAVLSSSLEDSAQERQEDDRAVPSSPQVQPVSEAEGEAVYVLLPLQACFSCVHVQDSVVKTAVSQSGAQNERVDFDTAQRELRSQT